MRSVRSAAPLVGLTVSPRELMKEFDELSSAFNALDRDNLPTPGVLTAAKVKLGAFRRLKTDPTASIRNVSHNEGQEKTEYPLPDSAGNPWVMEYDTADGIIDTTLFAVFTAYQPIWVGVRVNGLLSARSPWFEATGDRYTALITGAIAVGSGVQRIEMVYAHDYSSLYGTSWTTSFYDRRITVCEVLR